MDAIVNKFAKKCNKCDVKVEIGFGFAVKESTGWKTYCQNCVPVQRPRAEITSKGEIYFPYSPSSVSLVKSIPSARFQPEGKYWTVDTKSSNLPRILEVAKSLGLTIAPELLTANAFNEAAYDNELDAIIGTKKVFPFQREGVRFLRNQSRCILGDEMGTGKTVQALCSLDKGEAVLVVCPAALKHNWSDEIKRWQPDYTISILNGRGSFRFPNKGEIVIVNYDILPKEVVQPEVPFTMVCDEIHLCKNYKTKRSKAVQLLNKVAGKVIGLTGTPLTNRPFDLYGVLSTLGLAGKVFGKFDNFLKLFNAVENPWGGYIFGDPAPIVPELLRRVMLRRRREEVLPDLPKKSITNMTVSITSSKLRKELDEVYEGYESILSMTDEEDELPHFNEFSRLRAELAADRIPAMLEVIENHEEENIPLVVFSAHRAPILEIGKREGWAIITGDTKPENRQQIVRDFQSGKLKGVGVTIQAGGVGLTLTRAWKAIFVDLDWTPAWNSQAEDRICRIGQTQPVEIVRMVSDHVLDKHIHGLLSYKIDLFNKTIDAKIAAKPVAQGETEAEFMARMASVEDEIEKKQKERSKEIGLKKVDVIIEREGGKLGGSIAVPEFTPELKNQIADALKYMLGNCDGAVTRDAIGFNKPDAFLSRFLYMAGLEEEKTLLAAYLMLRRYPRQLKGNGFNLIVKDI